MSQLDAQMARAQAVKERYEAVLLRLPGVVGVGVGFAQQGGARTGEIAVVVMVERKQPIAALAADMLIPRTLDGVRVDVQEVGGLTAQ